MGTARRHPGPTSAERPRSRPVPPAYQVAFKTSGTYTWVCPQHVYRVLGIMVSAGGGGAGAAAVGGVNARNCSGGAGGGGLPFWMQVIPGRSYTITIGAKGTGGAAGDNNGTDGGSTTAFGITCPGGRRGCEVATAGSAGVDGVWCAGGAGTGGARGTVQSGDVVGQSGGNGGNAIGRTGRYTSTVLLGLGGAGAVQSGATAVSDSVGSIAGSPGGGTGAHGGYGAYMSIFGGTPGGSGQWAGGGATWYGGAGGGGSQKASACWGVGGQSTTPSDANSFTGEASPNPGCGGGAAWTFVGSSSARAGGDGGDGAVILAYRWETPMLDSFSTFDPAFGPNTAPGIFVRRSEYYSAGTYSWVCPQNVHMVYLEIVGGGGNASSSGGGGGGAGWAGLVYVQPGKTYSVTIGAAASSSTFEHLTVPGGVGPTSTGTDGNYSGSGGNVGGSVARGLGTFATNYNFSTGGTGGGGSTVDNSILGGGGAQSGSIAGGSIYGGGGSARSASFSANGGYSVYGGAGGAGTSSGSGGVSQNWGPAPDGTSGTTADSTSPGAGGSYGSTAGGAGAPGGCRIHY